MKRPPRRYFSLSQQLLAFFLLVTIAPVLALSLLNVTRTQRLLADEVNARQLETTRLIANQLELFLENVQRELHQTGLVLYHAAPVATPRPLTTISPDNLALLQAFIAAQQLRYTRIRVIDPNGYEIARIEGGVPMVIVNQANLSSLETFFRPMRGETYFSGVRLSNNVPYLDVALPLYEGAAGIIGVVIGQIDLREPWRVLQMQQIGRQGYTMLVDRRGNVITRPPRFRDDSWSMLNTPLMQAVLAAPDEAHTLRYTSPLGGQVLGCAVQIVGPDWVVITERPAAEVDRAAARARQNMLVAVTAALLLAVLLAALVSRWITRPIRQLSRTARAIMAGDFSATAQMHTHNEIGELADAFNLMTERLHELINELEVRVARRTRDLQIAADLSRQVATILNLEELLPKLAELTRAGFELYHVGVFLYDPAGEQLVLAGASSHSSTRQQIWQDPYVDLRDATRPGLIRQAARTRQIILANDVLNTPSYVLHPGLPDTRAELVLPLIVRHQFVGVLDLEDTCPQRFTEDEVRVMTSLADQVAVAIQNAQLYADQVRLAEDLRAVDVLKSQFIASMSHELRTPLNAILSLTQFLEMGVYGTLSAEQAAILRKVINSAEHLLSLINDILDITKLEAGMMELLVEPEVDLRAELQSVAATMEPLLSRKALQLVLSLPAELPAIVADKRRLRQIMMNLLSNAIKFTERGQITLRARRVAGEVEIAVQDTGLGIPPEDRAVIFESFRQTRVGLRQEGGTGLGLAISKKLAEAHEGRLWFESVAGVGATFYLALPIRSERLLRQMAAVRGMAGDGAR